MKNQVAAEATIGDGVLNITLPELVAGEPSQAQASAI